MNPFAADQSVFSPPRETILRPGGAGRWGNLAELWQYRDLLWRLGMRDVQLRYKQTLLGASWAVIQPVMMMIVFSLVFGRMLGVATDVDVPYPIFVYAGLLPWTFFSGIVQGASLSLVNNAGMLRKIYFPRLVMPLASVVAPGVDLVMAMMVLLGMMLFYGVDMSWQLLLLPVVSASVMFAALGIGVALSALTVSYRDVKHVIPYLIQLGLFVTPVIYPLEMAQDWAWLMGLNPMAGPVGAFRAAVLDQPIDWFAWGQSTAVAGALLPVSLWLFFRNERQFADVV